MEGKPTYEHSDSLLLLEGNWEFVWELPKAGSTTERGYTHAPNGKLTNVYEITFNGGVPTNKAQNAALEDDRPGLYDALIEAMATREQYIELGLAERKTRPARAAPATREEKIQKAARKRKWGGKKVDPERWEVVGQVDYTDENNKGKPTVWLVQLSAKGPKGNWHNARISSEAPVLHKGTYFFGYNTKERRIAQGSEIVKLRANRPGLYELTDAFLEKHFNV